MDDIAKLLESCTERVRAVMPEDGQSFSPRDAAIYLAHTENGAPIRTLAAATGTHPSTILRTVRRVEAQRDDPLYDKILSGIEIGPHVAAQITPAANVGTAPSNRISESRLYRDARKYLRRLIEPGSFLLVVPGAPKAGIFCQGNQFRKPIALIDVDLAAEFLKSDWIKVKTRANASVRYQITEVGRSFLRRTMSEEQAERAPKQGFAEASTPFLRQHQEIGEKLFSNPGTARLETLPVNLGESPVGWLARRKGPDGKPFLSPVEVEAAERLRCDFEAAHLGPQVAQDWRKFLTPGDRYSGSPLPGSPGDGPMMARDRVMKALTLLGPEMADVVVRVCCFLEGLEACEKRMGWSARAGKVVLRIALRRLADHYGFGILRA